jgi:hypothetical protein
MKSDVYGSFITDTALSHRFSILIQNRNVTSQILLPTPILKLNNATVLAQKVAIASDPEPVLFTLYPLPFTVLIYKEIGRKYQGCTN